MEVGITTKTVHLGQELCLEDGIDRFLMLEKCHAPFIAVFLLVY